MNHHIDDIFNKLYIPESPASLYDPIRYAMAGGGKRIRPTLLTAACQAFGGNIHDCVNQSIGIEIFHNFTLLHDDVMDKSSMRRGQPTVHCKWDENTAILSGDAMLTLASQYIARCSDRHLRPLIEVFDRTAIEVYEGQSLDMEFEKRSDVTVDEYIEMIRLKTAVLLACSLKMGAILADATPIDAESMYNYGINLGLGFQLRDDYLDTFGNPETFGKRIGGDILNNKKTWLWIQALSEDKSGIMKAAMSGSLSGETKIQQVSEVYRQLGLDKRILELIDNYSSKAIECLNGASVTDPMRIYFTDLALSLSHRNK